MALEASSLTGVRGDRMLFSGISFRLQAGEALWVGGSNGSGKTTLLRMLCGLVQPSAGDVAWNGTDIRHARDTFNQHLLYIGHQCAVKDDLNAWENLVAAAAIGGAPIRRAEADAALVQVGLANQSTLPGHALSQGQRQRAALARLFLEPPRALWVLDEPFTALDAGARSLLDAAIGRHLGNRGMLVYTSHEAPGFAHSAAVSRIDLDHAAPC